jgi:hypothetical protein
MDWDFIMDPSSPTTTPVWDAKGKLSNVIIAEGRGNTKKLAKNDGAKTLVMDLQDALSGSKHAQSIPNLAKQMALHLEKVKKKRDKEEEVSRFANPCLVDKNLARQAFVDQPRFVGSTIIFPSPDNSPPFLGRNGEAI